MNEDFFGNPCSAQLTAIHRISSALFAKTETDETLRETLEVSMLTASAEAGSILLYDAETKRLVFRYVIGPVAEKIVGTALSLSSEGKCATEFKTGVSDVSDEGFDTTIDEETGFRTRNALTTAIRTFGGQPIGVVQVLNKRDGMFDIRDRELLEVVSALAATVIENSRRAEVEKQAALAHAEAEKHAALSRALGFVGHQLKNQGLIISSASELFADPIAEHLRNLEGAEALAADFAEFQEMINSAKQKIIKQAGVINEYGQRKDLFEFKPNDLKAVLEEELKQMVELAPRFGLTLDMSGVGVVPTFPFDAFFVAQAVFNLVNNASQAIREKEKGDIIWVQTEFQEEGEFPDGRYVEISVRDNGPGITAEALTAILNGEAQSDRPGGSGVGTRLVHDVCLTHGGKFLGESLPGAGTRFRMRLPMSR